MADDVRPITDTELASELTGARLTDLEARMFLRIRADAERLASMTAENATLRARLEAAEMGRDEWRDALQGLHREWARGDGHGDAKATADCIAGKRITMSLDHSDEIRELESDRDTARAEADSWRKRAEAAEAAEAQLRSLTAPATAPKPTPGDEPTTPAPGSSDPSRTR